MPKPSLATLKNLHRVNSGRVLPQHRARLAKLVKMGLVDKCIPLGKFLLTDAGYKALCDNYDNEQLQEWINGGSVKL